MSGGHNATFAYPKFGFGAAQSAFLCQKVVKKQYTRAPWAPGAAQNAFSVAKSALGRTPGSGRSARPSGAVQTTHAASLEITFGWFLVIYALLPIMADWPSRAQCDDVPPARPRLAMAVLPAPWVRSGESRFSSLLRPRFL